MENDDQSTIENDNEELAFDTINNENSPKSQPEKSSKTRDVNRFPHTRIRTIMKMDPDLTIASQESVFLITKAAELFVQMQAQEAYKRTRQAKRKTVQKKDIDAALSELDCMAFLEGAID